MVVGLPVHVTFFNGPEATAFYTSIAGIAPNNLLLLRLPGAVKLQIQEQRSEVRDPVEQSRGVRIELTVGRHAMTFPVLDLSKRGLSFRFSVADLVFRKGAEFIVRLSAPGLRPIVTTIQLRSLRTPPGSSGTRVAGARVIQPTAGLLTWLRRAKSRVTAA
jgi:hypothetical protein